jgi:hypothetical protein
MSEGKKSKERKAAPARRRAPGLKALASSLPGVAEQALGRRGFADGALVADWSKIVGSDLARASLSFPNQRERTDGTLLLRVEPAFALILQHLQTQLLERVNGFFGYRAVKHLRILQGPLRRPDLAEVEVEAKELDPELRAAIDNRLADVEDEEFRGALFRLAESFHTRTKR